LTSSSHYPDRVATVESNQDKENQNMVVEKKDGRLSQQWELIYLDEMKKDPVKGELNEEYGIYVERDFYIISQLESNRYLDITGRDFAIKTRNGRTS
jgi:hypothetical protein